MACGLLFAAGCGKKGDPSVPVVPQPLPVINVGAQLHDQGVTLSWTPPAEYDTKKALRPDDIRSFTIYRQLQTPAANSWQFSQSVEGWQEIGETLRVKPYNGTLRTESKDTFLRVHSPEKLALDAATLRYLRLKLWTKNCQEGYVTFITEADKNWDKNIDVMFQPAVHTSSVSFQKAFDTLKTRAFPIETQTSVSATEYLIDMQSLPAWKGKIEQIGLVFEKSGTEFENAEIALESMEFVPSLIERAAVYDAPPYLFLDDEEGWTARGTGLFGAADGALYAQGTAPILLISKPGQQLVAKDAQFVRIRMQTTYRGDAYLLLHENPLSSLAAETISPERLAGAIRIALTGSPEWATYQLDLQGVFQQSGDLNTATQKKIKTATQIGLFFPQSADRASRQIAIDFIDVAGSEAQSASRLSALISSSLPTLGTIARHVQERQRTANMVFDVAYDKIPDVQAASSGAPIELAVLSPKEARQPDGSYAFTDTGTIEVGEKDDKKVANLEEGARYTYQIEMTDRKNRKSVLSTGITADMVKPLMPPRDLQAKPGDRTAELSWNPPLLTKGGQKARRIAEYRIFRTTTSGNYPTTPMIALQAGQTNFIDQNLTNGQQYFYAVQAVASTSSKPSAQDLSESVSVTPLDTVPPNAPTGLVGVYLGKAVNLHWNQTQTADFAGFNIYRSEQKDGGFERLNNAPVLNATYEDATAQEKKRYYYRVTTIDDETPPNESEPAVTLVETYLLD